jgi:hypothetical protein
MMLEATLQKLHDLRLEQMAAGFQEQQVSPTLYADLSFEERLGLLVDRECTARENRKLANLHKKAKLRYPGACLEEIDFRTPRGLPKDVLLTLARNGCTGKGVTRAKGSSLTNGDFLLFFPHTTSRIPRKARLHYPGAVYHVILRGNSGQDVFFDAGDRTRFSLLLQ